MTENEKEFKKEELQNLLSRKRENLKEIEQIGKNSNYIQILSYLKFKVLRSIIYFE